MTNTVIGRKEELAILQEVYESTESQLLAIYGRRRIGKTFLISEFFKTKGIYFEITGMKDGSTNEQLLEFAYEFSRTFNKNERISSPKNWIEALQLLHTAIESIDDQTKITLFFDELPWLASPRSKFLNALEHCWNRYLSRKKNVILVVCGSSASWMIKHIINNKGGLHGRITRKIRLLPFTLLETENYLKSRHINLDRKQILDLYMAIGGIPKYLSYLQKGESSAQFINNVCFSLNGPLYDEFNNLYRSLFDSYETHVSIVKVLSETLQGLTKEDILKKTNLTSGGTSSKILQELIDAGFLIYVTAFNKKKAKGFYRLIDEYSLFYLTWIAKIPKMSFESLDSQFWIKKQRTPQWNSWSGCAFEALCLKHLQKIKTALGISGISSIESGWRYVPKKGSIQIGAQIDLVIERADQCINLCEMKYTDFEFVIDKEYAEKLKTKKQIFKEQTKSNKTLFTTMVTTFGVNKNTHYLSTVDNQLTMDALF